MFRSLSLAFLTACAGPLQTVPFPTPAPAAVDLDAPGPVLHEVRVSARWAVPMKGLVDLDDPRAADLDNEKHPIVLPVHVLTHPTAGTFLVDSGFPEARSPGTSSPSRHSRRSSTTCRPRRLAYCSPTGTRTTSSASSTCRRTSPSSPAPRSASPPARDA